MKKLILSLVAALSLLGAAVPALATVGAWSNVTVTTIEPYPGSGNIVIVWFSANSTGSPCATQKGAAIVDMSTAAGAFAAAVAQSARLSSTTLSVVNGTGNCNLLTGYETLGVLEE